MTMKDLAAAAPALQKLILQDMPVRTAYALAGLIDRCNPALEFYGAEMRKLLTLPEDGRALRLMEMDEVEPEGFGGYRPLTLPLDMPLELSAADIKRLEPLVMFEEGGGKT